MTNYIKLLPNLIIAFNCCYCNPQNATVPQNNSPVQPMITTNSPNSQQIVPTQRDNTGLQTSFPQNSALPQQNTVIPNKHNALPLQRSATANVPNSNSIQILNNNPQTIQQNNAEVSKPIQQTKQISKVNTMTPQSKSNIIKQTSPVNQILPAKKFTNQSNSEQNLKNTINRKTSLGVTINSSQVLGNIPKITRKKTINTDTAKNINTEELALTAINANNNLKLTEIANRENMENKNQYINNQLFTLAQQAEGHFLEIDRLKQNWAASENYYSASNTNQITKDTIIIVDEQKRTILNNIYTIFDINIKEIQKSFSHTVLGSDTNKMLIDKLTNFKNNVLAPLKDFKLGKNNISQVPSSTYNSNIQNLSMYNCLIEAKEHKKKQKKDQYTQELLLKLAEWFKVLPQNKIAEQHNTENNGYNDKFLYDSKAIEEFIKDASTYYLKLPVLYKVK